MSELKTSRKRKLEHTFSPKQKTPNRPRSPPKKARNFLHKVLLVGFPEKEKLEYQKLIVGNVEFVDYLAHDITHIILKPASVKDKNFRWTPLYFGTIAGACFLRIDWLKKSFAKKIILKEEPFVFKDSDIDIRVIRSKLNKISLPEILKLSAFYSKMSGRNVFADEVFSRVLIIGRKTKEGRQRKNELRAVLEAGGAFIKPDDTLKSLKDKKNTNLWVNATAVFILNGDSLEDADINEEFIRTILLNRIPIMYEQFITMCIRQKLFPNREVMLTNSASYWRNDHSPNIVFDEQSFNYITSGAGYPTPQAFSSNKLTRRSRTKSPSMMDDLNESSISHISLSDFEREISENNLTVHPEPLLAEEEEEDERAISLIFSEANLSQTTISVLSDFTTVLGEADVTMFNEKPPLTWVDWRAELSICIPQALARAGTESGYMSENAVSAYNMICSDFSNYEPTSAVHDLICHDSVSYIRHSMDSNFLPEPDILSKMLHEIAMPSYGTRFDSSDSVYKLIAALLKQFPPTHSGGRLYWLKVFSQAIIVSNARKSEELTPIRRFKAELKSFREKVFNTFSKEGTNPNLMSLLLMLLEYDLYALQGCGLTGSQEAFEREPDTCSSKTRSRCSENEEINLEGIPLAFLVLFEPSGYRRRGLDETSKKSLADVTDYLSANEFNSNLVRSCSRFIAVVLESVRWYSVEILHCAESGQLPIEMQQDLKYVMRHFLKKGWDVKFLKQVFPLIYMYPLIDSLA